MPTTADRRVALYSHDSQGLGHVRRNIELAAAMVRHHPRTDVLLVASALGADRLPLPPRTWVALVPRVSKDPHGQYTSADPRIPLARTLRRRSHLTAALLHDFRPDLLVVDKLPRGLGGELDLALQQARTRRGSNGLPTRVVLGLRDVLDAPDVTRREWAESDATSAVLAYYDEVWVYGDPAVYDLVREYALPTAVAERTQFTGYLARQRGTDANAGGQHIGTRHPYVLGMLGGGQDGRTLAESFVRADVPARHHALLVAGPQMSDSDLAAVEALAADRPAVRVLRFVTDAAALVHGASAVVTMGGYNSVCEVLDARRPALVIPRVRPRREQAVRAEHLALRTHLDTLHPDRVTPRAIAAWTSRAVRRRVVPGDVDLDGLTRVPQLVERLLAPTAIEVGAHVSA